MINMYSSRIISGVNLLLAFSVALFLSACSSSKLSGSWVDPVMQEPLTGEVFVVGVTHMETVRRLVENSLVEGFMDSGVLGIASYSVMENKGEVTLDEVKSAIAASKAESLLVIRLADSTSVTLEQDATGRNYDTIDQLERDPYFFNPNPKQSVRTTTRMTLISRLYDVNTQQLVWSATSHSVDPVMTKKYADKLTSLFLKDLKKQGLI